jgi:hypothetical protein
LWPYRGPVTERSDQLTASLDAAWRPAAVEPLSERGYRRSGRFLRRRSDDLYVWIQLAGRGPAPHGTRRWEVTGGVAVEGCLPFTKEPAKPWQRTQLTLPWMRPSYSYQPGIPAEGWQDAEGIILSFEHLVVMMTRERERFEAEIGDRYHSSADVLDQLWESFATDGPVWRPRHLAILLAQHGDKERLDRVVSHFLGEVDGGSESAIRDLRWPME